jgi:hypothetical protein
MTAALAVTEGSSEVVFEMPKSSTLTNGIWSDVSVTKRFPGLRSR